MNRGSMSKQISTAPKSKSKKVKKMAFGGLTPPPGFQQAVGPQQAIQQSPRPAGMNPGTPVTAAGTQPDPGLLAQMMEGMQAGAPTQVATQVATPLKPGRGRPGMGDMPRGPRPGKPPPMVSQPGMGPRMGGMPPKPGMGLAGMKKGGMVKGYAKGGKIDGCCMKGKTKGMMK